MHKVSSPETEMHDVQLLKSESGLGITVAGYVCDEEDISGIFVRDISSGSVADLTGNIKINDRIVKVNGKCITTLTNQEAIELLKNSGPIVIISVERYPRGSKYERLQYSNARQKPFQPSGSPKYYMSTIEQDVVKSGQKERMHLKLVAESTEEDEKSGQIDSVYLNKQITFEYPYYETTSVNEFKIETDFIKNAVVETPLNTNIEEKSDITPTNQPIFTTSCDSTINQDSGLSSVDTISKVCELLPLPSNKNSLTEKDAEKNLQIGIKSDNSVNSDSSCIYFSKSSDDTEKDGYETCIDESFSEDIYSKVQVTTTSCDNVQLEAINSINNNPLIARTITPNSPEEHFHCVFLDACVSATSSEPCLNSQSENFLQSEIRLSWTSDGNSNLKSYDNPPDIAEGDEFFLVQCVDDNISVNVNELNKCLSEPNVPESYEVKTTVKYKCLKLEEYYNDYEDCIEEYRRMCKYKEKEETFKTVPTTENETSKADYECFIEEDNATFQQRVLPFKCSSAPTLVDCLNELEICQSHERSRTNSFPPSFLWKSEDTAMTVTSPLQNLERNPSNNELENHWGSTKCVEIFREADESLGITIVCGKVDIHTLETSLGTISGIFVKSIVPNSAAGKNGQFQPGDRILKVGGVDLTEAGQEEALTAIRRAGDPIVFVVQSLLPFNEICIHPSVPSLVESPTIEEREQIQGISNEEILNIETKDIQDEQQDKEKTEKKEDYSDEEEEDEDEDEEDTRLLGGRTLTKQGKEIDRSSAGNLKRSKEDIAADKETEDEYGYTTDKIRKKYVQLGTTIMMVQLERGQEGLGLSLAGHKDRNCMAVFVCGLHPNGVAYKTGGIQVGDEILEVNGVVLHGRCHLNASAIIKGLAGPIFKIVILRRKAAVEDIAVRPLTHFPVLLDEEISEDKFSNYPNVRNVAIKKGNHSLGIMIIEGKHSKLGQGIFISDIQDGSAAEKAGLEVGEMILAVNKDSLLGANYDTAAGLLKRTEGVVTLILSNPAKKPAAATTVPTNTETELKPATILKASVPPSRAVTPIPEPPVDPTTTSIIPGKNTTIEMITDNRGLGLFFVGGKDTLISDGIVVVEVFPGGAADKDGRINAGDQIIDVNGVCLKEVTNQTALQTLRQILPKMKLIILRPDKIEYTTVEVDLTKKPGKGLGLSLTGRRDGNGVYVSEILNGGNADIDGRIAKGDILVSVNGQNTENLNADEVGALLKTLTGRTVLKFHRYKPTVR